MIIEIIVVGLILIANKQSNNKGYKEGVIDTERAYKSKLRLIADSEMEAWAKLGETHELTEKKAKLLNEIINIKDRELNILRSEKAYNNRKKERKMRKKGREIR